MRKTLNKIFAVAMALAICFSFNATPVFAMENVTTDMQLTEKTEEVETLANYVIIDSFNLSATPGNSDVDSFYVTGYSQYKFVLTFKGVNGAVVNCTQTIPNGTMYAIANGSTIGTEITTYTTTCSASGLYIFNLYTWDTSPNAAVVNVAVYGK